MYKSAVKPFFGVLKRGLAASEETARPASRRRSRGMCTG
jgi:hypothetical protein